MESKQPSSATRSWEYTPATGSATQLWTSSSLLRYFVSSCNAGRLWFNSTITVRRDTKKLETKSFAHATRAIRNLDEMKQIVREEYRHREVNPHPVNYQDEEYFENRIHYNLYFQNANGKCVPIVSRISNAAQAMYIQQEIGIFLSIQQVVVDKGG